MDLQIVFPDPTNPSEFVFALYNPAREPDFHHKFVHQVIIIFPLYICLCINIYQYQAYPYKILLTRFVSLTSNCTRHTLAPGDAFKTKKCILEGLMHASLGIEVLKQ